MCIICDKSEIIIGNKYCSRQCLNIQINRNKKDRGIYESSNQKVTITKYGELKKFTVFCYHVNCQKQFQVTEREKQFPKKEKYFCSVKCRNSRIENREIVNKKISKSVKEYFENLSEEEFNKILSSRKEKNIFRSKGEIDLLNKLQSNFPQFDFKSGGAIKYNGLYHQYDIKSNALKIYIEYDGIWHFKDIKGQLEHKQFKDREFENFVSKTDFRLIRVFSHDFLKNEIEYQKLLNAIFKSEEKLIKLY